LKVKYFKLVLSAVSILALAGPELKAQYLSDQQLGIAGLQAGSQPPPGFYFVLPLYYRDSGISIYDAQGNRLVKDVTANINLFVLPAIQVVTTFKILGANYGAAVTEWVSNGNLTAAANFKRSTNYGFGDMYVQPLILGWHMKQADITAGYSFFAPTGTGSAGQHMWVNEGDFGGTLFLDPAKEWNLSTMMYYDFNRKKSTSDITVGNTLTLAGGAAKSFRKGLVNIGAAYGAQWKTTRDSGSDIPAFLPITDGRVFGVGPQADVRVFMKGLNLGMLSFRYLWLVGARTALGGQVLTASFTFAKISPPR
jgi:hypothetical protein